MNQKNGLSVIIITFNEAEKIEQCLESVRWADEIIVVDSGSTDDTLSIAKKFTDHVITNTPWPGFGQQKNIALQQASMPWVLSIDADERISQESAQEIQQIISSTTAIAYDIPRSSSFCGRFMKHCGWTPDYVLRLFRRDMARFSDDLVHERVIIDSSEKTARLIHPIIHYAIDNTAQARKKMHSYADLSAQNKWKQGKKSHPIKAVSRAFWTLLRTYVFQLGFLDKKQGLMLSYFNAGGTYYKYAKLHQYQRNKAITKSALIITTYNSPKPLEAVLLSVCQQYKMPNEVIIADDGSGAETKQLIERYQAILPCTLKHVWQEDNGFRAATIRNKAAAAMSEESNLLIYIDGDCLLQPDFIANHEQFAEAGYFSAGNRVMLSPKQTENLIHAVTSENNKNALSTFIHCLPISSKIALRYFPLGWLRKTNPKTWKGAKTCNLAICKEDFMQINGFDEDFNGWGYEDSDLVIRLLNNGCKRLTTRFGTTLLHLWHESNFDAEKSAFNKIKLQDTISNGSIRSNNGINQYTEKTKTHTA